MKSLTLVTYLPYNRIFDLKKYFEQSVKNSEPDEVAVFIDNVYDEWQVEILREKFNFKIYYGSWNSRILTWISILDFFLSREGSLLVVDSDNVLDKGVREFLKSYNEKILTFMDWDDWNNGSKGIMPRSERVGEIEFGGVKRPLYEYQVYNGSIFSSGATFFIGPKQAVFISSKIDEEIYKRLKAAVLSLPKSLAKHITDETFLGVLAYLIGLKKVKWTVGSRHFSLGPEVMIPKQLKIMRAVTALSHEVFADSLYKQFRLNEFKKYKRKYMLARVKNTLSSLM